MVEYRFYRFASRAAYEASCTEGGIDLSDPPAEVTLDVIGEIAGELGWHVNGAWNGVEAPAAFAAAEIHPDTPVRVFAQRQQEGG